MQIFMLKIFAKTMTKWRNFIGRESHVIAVQPPLGSALLKTALNNVLLPTLFNVVKNIVQHCYTWSSATVLAQQCWKIDYSRFCASVLLITNVDHIVQILRFKKILNWNAGLYSFRSIANPKSVRYSIEFYKYSSSKCKQSVCLHY